VLVDKAVSVAGAWGAISTVRDEKHEKAPAVDNER